MFERGSYFKTMLLLTAAALLGAVGLGWVGTGLHAADKAKGQAKKPAKKKAVSDDPMDKRAADRAAIRKATESFVKALEKGDARAVAAHWTAEGEYVAADGTTYRGRAALEKAYAEFFKENGKLTVEAEVQSLRFLSSNTAVEEGYLKVRKGKATELATSRFSALHVREDGKWLLAVVRDWRNDGQSLRDLEWLIGTWKVKRGDVEVLTTYTWDAKKVFLRSHFTIKDRNGTTTGTQVIGKDPSTGSIRSWTFESEGGFGEAEWSRDGKKWVMQAKGVQADGSKLTATNILTRINDDTFTWQSVDRTLDEEEQDNVAPIRVTRVRAAK